MVELAALFGGSFVLAMSGALMPGPLLTVTISESARRGFSAGPLLMVGHAILELLLVVAIIKGLGPYLEMQSVTGTIALLGGALLIYLGFDMVRSAAGLSLNMEAGSADARLSRHPILLGALFSLSNPYWTLWWATIGLGYLIAAMSAGIAGVAAFFIGHITADFAWYSLVSLGISRGKTLLGDRSYQNIIRACGVVLFGFGGWFLVSAGDYLGGVF